MMTPPPGTRAMFAILHLPALSSLRHIWLVLLLLMVVGNGLYLLRLLRSRP